MFDVSVVLAVIDDRSCSPRKGKRWTGSRLFTAANSVPF